MTLDRRRFLAISAAFTCYPATAKATTWRGFGFGAEISITLHGPSDIARPALLEAKNALKKIESLFSLYDAASALSELNATGFLKFPAPDFLALIQASDLAYRTTFGLFDPTVQTLWHARATRASIVSQNDWSAVRFQPQEISLETGQQLTFNGIAQGYATDLVTEVLSRHGLTEALVNIGEFRSLGGDWRLGIADPEHGLLGTRTLSGRAIATSSSFAHSVAGQSHIMHHTRTPKWSTVSVEADTATAADSLSTALTLATREQIETIYVARDDVHSITLIDKDGNLTTI